MSKLNPWRNGSLFESIVSLEKSGVRQPKAFALIAEILEIIGGIEREDDYRERCRKASEAASRSGNQQN